MIYLTIHSSPLTKTRVGAEPTAINRRRENMAKKRTTNDRPGRAKTGTTTALSPSVANDDPVSMGEEAKAVAPYRADDDVSASGVEDVNAYDDLRHSLSDELLPLTSSSSGYSSLAKLMLPHDICDEGNERDEMKRRLISTSVKLFRHIELLAHVEDGLRRVFERRRERERRGMENDDDNDDGVETGEEGEVNGEEGCCILSGIPSLYVGDDRMTNMADAETMWGQVDMQNDALMSLLKKRVRELTKRCTNGGGDENETVRILRTMEDDSGEDDVEDDDDDDDDDEVEDDAEDGENSNDDEEDDEDNDDDDDEGRRRIRERMKRAMADMYGDDDDDDVHSNNNNDDEADDDDEDRKIDVSLTKASSSSGDVGDDDDDAIDAAADNDNDGGVDPTREEMLDGFFDLHEMEAFADEEEEMLPDDAFGEEDNDGDEDDGDIGGKKKKKDKKGGMLPHIRDRLGDGSESDDDVNDDEEDEEDEEDLLSKRYQPTTVRRKKYRPDDEVEALCEWSHLYLFFFISGWAILQLIVLRMPILQTKCTKVTKTMMEVLKMTRKRPWPMPPR
jgi:U3 small nucleolar RNA-associated protein MPP10